MSDKRAAGGIPVGFVVAFVLKILLLCLVVGFVLTWLDLGPLDLLRDLGQRLRGGWEGAKALFGWATPYVLLGATVVVPIVLLGFAWKFTFGRRRGESQEED